MPSQKELQYRRTHNLLLIQKLLGGRENASPFTLVLDSLEQSGRPLVREMMRRANAAKTNVVYVAFETVRKPTNVDTFIHAFELSPNDLQKRLSKTTTASSRNLIIIDTLHPLLSNAQIHIPSFLAGLMSPSTSVVASFHTDISTQANANPYAPSPLTLLRYLATTIFTAYSLHHILTQKAARDRAEPEPLFGLGGEEIEGVIQGLGSNDPRGVVIEMEYRRKSGRGVGEWFVLPLESTSSTQSISKERKTATLPGRDMGGVILLEDHPLYARPAESAAKTEEVESTFSLGLTEKQRKDREGVVLPYFDAQTGEGGEGGRILYEMGIEDDFDEEEDEI